LVIVCASIAVIISADGQAPFRCAFLVAKVNFIVIHIFVLVFVVVSVVNIVVAVVVVGVTVCFLRRSHVCIVTAATGTDFCRRHGCDKSDDVRLQCHRHHRCRRHRRRRRRRER
jgi:hypothetical protein